MKSYFRISIIFLLVGYTLLLSYWMLWGFGRTPHAQYMYNLIPFRTIKVFMKIQYFNSSIWIINLLGNIGVFVPFGILLPVIFKRKYSLVLGIFFSGLFVLESLQLLTRRGSFDIDDFILNGIGFTMGYGIFLVLKKWVVSRSTP